MHVRNLLIVLSCWIGALSAQTLQLADGRILLANVEAADGEGLRVRRLDNGGVLDLRWDHLTQASATDWKRKFDLIGDQEDELVVRAEEISFLRGGGRQVLVGRLRDASSDPMVVVVKGQENPIPRSELIGVRKVDVPAAQVYTKEEFYSWRRAELAPGDSADKHMVLAEDLIKFGDYDRAAEHLDTAQQLGNSRNPKHLDVLRDRLQRFREASKELGLLKSIQTARNRGSVSDFEKGRKLIEQFEKDFPQTRLKTEFDKEKRRFEEVRTRFYGTKVADLWRHSIQVVAEKKIGEEGFQLAQARDYAENKMSEDILARVSQSLRIEPEETSTLWSKRAEFPGGKRTEHFGYGIGSWVLGEQAILKDTATGKSKAAQDEQQSASDNREIERFARLLREAMQRRQQASGGGQGQQKEVTEDDWWREASRQERVAWLRAYYAEFGGQLVLTLATTQPCLSCYGDGSMPEMVDGKPARVKCFMCQGTKYLRSFKAY